MPIQRGGGYTQSCADNGLVMIASFASGSIAEGSLATWQWVGRDGLPLRSFVIRRQWQLPVSLGAGTLLFRINSPTLNLGDPDVRDICNSRMACDLKPSRAGVVSASGLDATLLMARLECLYGTCVDDGSNGQPAFSIESATLTLEDAVPPRFEKVAGTLVSGQPLWGTADLTYSASDAGAGVYRHRLEVDGRGVFDEVVDANGQKCRDAMPGWGTAYEFDYMVPCALSTKGRMVVDLGQFATGRHDAVATIEDAAGNRRTLFEGPIQIVSDPARRQFDTQGIEGLTNPLGDRPGNVVNGIGGSRAASLEAWMPGSRGRRVVRSRATYPRASKVMAGLTSGGVPIARATVAVLEREARTASWRAVASVITSDSGQAVYVPPPGPSRAVRFAYFPDSEALVALTSSEVGVEIRPRVRLAPSPRALRTGQRVRFSGRVEGVVPASNGVMVTLQAGTAGSKWVTFRVVRTAADGSFRASYRFTKTRGRVRYRFRAIVPRQASHPFERGTSASTWVRVRG
jgi:hypothetical protein